MRAELQEKLDNMIVCGYPIFVIAGIVAFPAEADEFFTQEEMAEVESYILSTR